eukprot:m.46298 g.46298  ORF g.46298 m.46298 type:complete len:175 (+) comp7260_c0_seq2:2131-2655(+)
MRKNNECMYVAFVIIVDIVVAGFFVFDEFTSLSMLYLLQLKKTRVNPLTLQFCFKFLVPVLRNTCGDILLTRIACMFSSNTLPSTLHSWLEDCLREFDKVFHEERPIDITEDTNIPNENGNDTLDDSDSDAGDEDESSAIKIPTSALQEMEQSSDNLRLLPFIIQGCKISKKDF